MYCYRYMTYLCTNENIFNDSCFLSSILGHYWLDISLLMKVCLIVFIWSFVCQEEHLKELDSLKASTESSALSMAETKKQLFEELQVKEAEAERYQKMATALETQLEEERSHWEEQIQNKQQELEEKEAVIQVCLHELSSFYGYFSLASIQRIQ